RLEGSRSSHAGVISEVATSAEGDGRTYRVRLTVAGGGLLPGARATCLVEVAAVEAALAVPRAAVVDLDSDAPYVFVLRDGRAVKRPVTLGLRGNNLLQIVEGLAASDQVVLEGNDTLHDGEPVEVR
ncbi:MAG TPA: hypothetical protein DCZ72_11285, partial [Armatimonadetes bacterium]|nr:hypothetical protein [Armatimonadota bacterium]